MLPMWAWIIALAFYGLLMWHRLRRRRGETVVSAIEGRHRPMRGGKL